jgi:hypothetical protein
MSSCVVQMWKCVYLNVQYERYFSIQYANEHSSYHIQKICTRPSKLYRGRHQDYDIILSWILPTLGLRKYQMSVPCPNFKYKRNLGPSFSIKIDFFWQAFCFPFHSMTLLLGIKSVIPRHPDFVHDVDSLMFKNACINPLIHLTCPRGQENCFIVIMDAKFLGLFTSTMVASP